MECQEVTFCQTERFGNRLKQICFVLLMFNVIGGITAITLTIVTSVRRSSEVTYTPTQQEAAVQQRHCKDDVKRWALTVDEVTELFEKMYLSHLKKKSVNNTKEDTTSYTEQHISFLSVSKPVVHVQGLKYLKTEMNDSSLRVIRNWNNEGQSHLILVRNGMTYENGAITIPTRGSYRVYSQVVFSQIAGQRSEVNSELFEHQVLRYNAEEGRVEQLLSSSHSECESVLHNSYDEFPSYVSRVVSLNSGDTVFVKTSHFNMLMADRNKHYFGVHFVW